MTDVFLSYQRGDRACAQSLARALAARQLEVWWDTDLLPGERFADEIALVIERAKSAVVLWSTGSVKSNWVRAEASRALDRGILIPARLDDCDLPLPFNNLHTIDLRDWNGRPDDPIIAPLVDAIARAAGGTTADVAALAGPGGREIDRLHGHDEEARLWAAVSTRNPQSSKEYNLYLARHPEGLFADLARLRLEELGRRPPLGPKAIMAAITAVLALASGVFGLVTMWPEVVAVLRPKPGIQEPARSDRPETSNAAPSRTGTGESPAPERPEARTDLPDCDAAKPLELCRDRLVDGSVCPWCPEMVPLPAGHFLMGQPADELMGQPADQAEPDITAVPQHPVSVRAFAMGRFEVTVAEFETFAQRTGHEAGDCFVYHMPYVAIKTSNASWRDPGFPQERDHPVTCISWEDAQTYAGWLSEVTGQPYRLPSEAEWEYATRAGTTAAYAFGNELRTTDANHAYLKKGTTPAGAHAANAWGLHDVHGNVFELVADCVHDSYVGAPADGTAWLHANGGDCDARVMRGGSWAENAATLRSDHRRTNHNNTVNKFNDTGIRIARDLPPEAGAQ